MSHIITLDVGTTSVKTCLFDESLGLAGQVSCEYALLTPGKDIVELPAEEYWSAARNGIREVVEKSRVNPDLIGAICLTTQGETMIPVDGGGTALCNALVWIDARAVEETEILRRAIPQPDYYRFTGLPEMGPANPLCKALWFKRNRPDIFARVRHFLLLEDYLIHRLTGRFVSHPSLMSSTGYYDIQAGKPWNVALDAAGIDGVLFPPTITCGSIAGTLRPPVASDLGLHSSTNVVAGAMDQIASAIGAGNIRPGMVTETTGTALVVGATIDRFDPSATGGVQVYRHYNDKYLLLPYCTTAGIILKWFKDEFCREEVAAAERQGRSAYDLMDRMAEEVEPVPNGLVLVPHFAGKLQPDMNPAAKGVLFGLGLETRKPHLVRAILEGVAFMLRENIEMVEKTGVRVDEIRSLGGGSKGRLWNAIKADVCDKNIITMEQGESTSLGAAILGAVATGRFRSVDEACATVAKTKDVFHPDGKKHQMYDRAYKTWLRIYEGVKSIVSD